MLKVHEQRHIRFAKIEQPNAWVVVAFVVETQGDQTVVLSAPKVVKIIPKVQAALPGHTTSLLLSAPKVSVSKISRPVVSPFASFFGFTNIDIITGLGAQPPTTY